MSFYSFVLLFALLALSLRVTSEGMMSKNTVQYVQSWPAENVNRCLLRGASCSMPSPGTAWGLQLVDCSHDELRGVLRRSTLQLLLIWLEVSHQKAKQPLQVEKSCPFRLRQLEGFAHTVDNQRFHHWKCRTLTWLLVLQACGAQCQLGKNGSSVCGSNTWSTTSPWLFSHPLAHSASSCNSATSSTPTNNDN